MRWAFAAMAALAGVAHADNVTSHDGAKRLPVAGLAGARGADKLSLDAPVAATLDRARVRIDVEHGRAVLAITLSSHEATPHVGSIGIRVPHGTRAIGMTAAGVVAMPMDSLDARERLSDVVAGRRDPALLEQSSGEPDRLVLRVFPLAKGVAMTVEVELELPAGPSVSVAPPIDGPRIVALPRRAWMEDDPAARISVDARTSLFATAPPPDITAVPTVVIGTPVASCECEPGPTPRSIRQWIHLQIPRLQHCYERELQRDRTLAGEADLHFTIDPDGHTSDITIDGTLDSADATSCLAAEVATWEFAQGRRSTRVNYPLQFRLAR